MPISRSSPQPPTPPVRRSECEVTTLPSFDTSRFQEISADGAFLTHSQALTMVPPKEKVDKFLPRYDRGDLLLHRQVAIGRLAADVVAQPRRAVLAVRASALNEERGASAALELDDLDVVAPLCHTVADLRRVVARAQAAALRDRVDGDADEAGEGRAERHDGEIEVLHGLLSSKRRPRSYER